MRSPPLGMKMLASTAIVSSAALPNGTGRSIVKPARSVAISIVNGDGSSTLPRGNSSRAV